PPLLTLLPYTTLFRSLHDVDLFDSPPTERPPAAPAPLADRMRPRTLDEVVGQEHLVGPGKVLRRSLEDGALHSMILWGPPGTGRSEEHTSELQSPDHL